MRKIAITILSLLALGQAPALAQATDQVAELQQNSDWFKTSFRELWTACIERSPDIQFMGRKFVKGDSAEALYKAWVNNACTVPGKEHYYNVKQGYGSPAEVSPVIYGPPEIEGKPILSLGEALTLQSMVRNNHEHLYRCACDYVREPSGKIHESANKALIDMCGKDAVMRLDEAVAKNKLQANR